MSGKFCKSCGATLASSARGCTQGHSMPENARFCAQCGSPAQGARTSSRPTPPPAPIVPSPTLPPVTINNTYAPPPLSPYPIVQKTNGMAIASLAISIACCGPVGMILGFVAISQINKDPSQKGKGLATAGIIVGAIGIFGAIIYFAAGASGY